MKSLNYYLGIFFIILPFSSFALVPFPLDKEMLNTIKVQRFIDMPLKDIDKKLDKKLKWHEKLALKSLKRKLKKQAKMNPTILQQQLNIEKERRNPHHWLNILIGLILMASLFLAKIIINCNKYGCYD